METSKQDASPLESAAGVAGPQAIEAFSVLGDETRLSILLALWEAYEPWSEDNTVPFTELREWVGSPDSGQFNYHLGKLTGHFVRKIDAGYELRRAGHLIVRTVIAGTGLDEPALERAEIDQDCYVCGGSTEITYHDEWLFWVCTECDGKLNRRDVPAGTLAGGDLDPAGFAGRTPDEQLNAAWSRGLTRSTLGGVCDACTGPMESWLHVCDDHAAEGLCPDCGWRYAAVARFCCSVCKQHHQMVPWWLVLDHPAVVAFYYDHGVALQYEDGVHFQPRIELSLQAQHSQELVAEDPPVVRVTIQYEGDELQLTMDENLDVVEVHEQA